MGFRDYKFLNPESRDWESNPGIAITNNKGWCIAQLFSWPPALKLKIIAAVSDVVWKVYTHFIFSTPFPKLEAHMWQMD